MRETLMTTPDWEKVFDRDFGEDKVLGGRPIDEDKLKSFIRQAIADAEKRGEERGRRAERENISMYLRKSYDSPPSNE